MRVVSWCAWASSVRPRSVSRSGPNRNPTPVRLSAQAGPNVKNQDFLRGKPMELPKGTRVQDLRGACPGAAGRVRLRYGTNADLTDARATDWADVAAETTCCDVDLLCLALSARRDRTFRPRACPEELLRGLVTIVPSTAAPIASASSRNQRISARVVARSRPTRITAEV